MQGSSGTIRKDELRVVFLGGETSRYSIACLKAILESGVRPVAVGIEYRAPRKFNRAMRIRIRRVRSRVKTIARKAGKSFEGYRLLQELAQTHGIRQFSARDINSRKTIARLASVAPDIVAIGSFSGILRQEAISLPRLACINVHPSLLPSYRGIDPYGWVIENGEPTTGVTVHHVNQRIDAGDIILQREISIEEGETAETLGEKSAPVAAELLAHAIQLIASGQDKRTPQDESKASYYGRR